MSEFSSLWEPLPQDERVDPPILKKLRDIGPNQLSEIIAKAVSEMKHKKQTCKHPVKYLETPFGGKPTKDYIGRDLLCTNCLQYIPNPNYRPLSWKELHDPIFNH